MPGRFFDDILEDTDKRMGYSPYGDPNGTSPWRDWCFKLKAEPKDNVNMKYSKAWLSEWQNDAKQESTETGSSMEINCDKCGMESKLDWSDGKMRFEVEKNICDDDWKAEFDVKAKAKQQDGRYEIRPKIKFSTPDFSGARLWCNLAAIFARTGENKTMNLEKKVNLSYEDEYHVGYRVKHNTEEISAGWAQAVWTPKDKKDTAFWIRGDKNQKTASLGAAFPWEYGGYSGSDAYEASYSTVEGFKGIKGHPVVLRGGYEMTFDGNHKHSMHATWGEHFEVWNKSKHKVDDHWTFGFKQRFDSSKLSGKESPYDIGFWLAYKL